MLWLVERLDKSYSPRLRLAVCACARTALQYVPVGENRPRLAIECAERYARGEATEQERAAAWAAAGAATRAAGDAWAAWDAGDAAWDAWAAARAAGDAWAAAWDAGDAARAAGDAGDAALRQMAVLVREIIPNPEVSA